MWVVGVDFLEPMPPKSCSMACIRCGYHAVPNGVAAGPVALIICLQLPLTGMLASYLFSVVVTVRQWFGLFLGLLGTVFIVDTSIGVFSQLMGLICTLLS